MSKTKKILLILLIIFLFILAGIVILMYSFTQGMKGDADEVKKVRVQAEQYLERKFKNETKIYDVLYDNMGNFEEFEYAAKVREAKSGTDFLVYSNVHTGKMADSFISAKWRDDSEKELKPYFEDKLGNLKLSKEMKKITDSNNYDEIKAKIGNSNELVVLYEREIGKELNIDPNNPISYKEYDVAPTVLFTIHRKKRDTDENDFKEIIHSIKNDDVLKHGELIVSYISTDGVPLEDDEWRKTF
ncbi:hypothetical protein [Peribacillus sp. NPDC097295]|uniref:hypothetical protein n=1 Tax=Peribacillus sp. NPDC097295 TaxID=3364402 RepID=UPI0038172507